MFGIGALTFGAFAVVYLGRRKKNNAGTLSAIGVEGRSSVRRAAPKTTPTRLSLRDKARIARDTWNGVTPALETASASTYRWTDVDGNRVNVGSPVTWLDAATEGHSHGVVTRFEKGDESRIWVRFDDGEEFDLIVAVIDHGSWQELQSDGLMLQSAQPQSHDERMATDPVYAKAYERALATLRQQAQSAGS
jgi:hypothetical protein